MHPVGGLSKALNKSVCVCVCVYMSRWVYVYIEAILTENNSYSNT